MNLHLLQAAPLPLANHRATSYMIRQGAKLFRPVFPPK